MAKLYFRYGAMNSGKSTALMQVAHNYEERGMRVLSSSPLSTPRAAKNSSRALGWSAGWTLPSPRIWTRLRL